MLDFKSFSALEKYLEKQISESLQIDVAKKSMKLMKEHIQTDVYEAYTPYSTDGKTPHYERTFELLDSCETNMIDNETLELKNTRTDEETGVYIAPIIEYGEGYTWGYTRDLDEEIGERPFIANTKRDLESGLATEYMVKALRKRGLKVE